MAERLKAHAGTALGMGGLVLVAAGAWGYYGWPAACLAFGLPLAAFYIWAEARKMRGGG